MSYFTYAHTIYYILSLYIYIIIRHKYYIYTLLSDNIYRIFHWKYFIGIKEISSEFGYQHRRSPIHRSNSNIKLIATLLSTTRATYLNSTIRLETTATPLPPLPSAFTCLSDACNSTAIEIADLEPEPAYIVWPLPAEILDLLNERPSGIMQFIVLDIRPRD